MNMGAFVRGNILYIIGVVILVIAVFLLVKKRSRRFQFFLGVVAIKLPLFGALVKLNNLSRISSTVAEMLKNHIPLQETLKNTYEVIDNKVYQELLIEARKNITQGDFMSKAFEHHYASEVVFNRMMHVGERSGELGKMMKSLSDFYDEDSEVKIERLKKALEPLLLIFIYALIVVMILAVMLPSLALSDQLM